MKILVVGLGSMGKRRIRNLQHLGIENIIGCDIRKDRLNEAITKYNIKAFTKFEKALLENPEIVIISLPPKLHIDYLKKCINLKKPFFVELNILSNGLPSIIKQIKENKIIGIPSSTMRYFEGPKIIKKLVNLKKIGMPLAWIYHSGQYLHDWHPWESIKNLFISEAETSGCKELAAIEIGWLTDTFGSIKSVYNQASKVSKLKTKIDDINHITIEHESGVTGTLVVDVISRIPVRNFRLLCTNGILEWDNVSKIVRYSNIKNKKWITHKLSYKIVENAYINPEEPYIEEMKDFIDCIKYRKKPKYTFEQDYKNLKVLDAIETSSKLTKKVVIK